MTIAEPLANIINRYMDTEKMAKYSDPAALLIAVITITLPRIMITATTKKKEVKPIGQPKQQPAGPIEGSSKSNGREDQRPVNGSTGGNDTTDADELLKRAINCPY
jgi:hypothetical protein